MVFISLIAGSAFSLFAELIKVSVTGTANATGMGYTQSESYTFHWVVNDGYTGSDGFGDGGDVFDTTENRWFSTSTNDPWLWASISGNGLVGSYSKPVGSALAPWEQLKVDSSGLLLWVGNDDYNVTSLGVLVNGEEFRTLVAYDLNISGLDYSNASFLNPTVYLADYTGTYTSTGGGVTLMTKMETKLHFQQLV